MSDRIEANSKEMKAIELMAALDSQLEKKVEVLRDRLKSVPDLLTTYREAQFAMDRVLVGIYQTLPEYNLAQLHVTSKMGEVVIRPVNTLNKTIEAQIVRTKDLDKLINATIASTCAMCMKEGREIKKCELRKALMNICPPSDISGESLCVFTQVAANCELGEYI